MISTQSKLLKLLAEEEASEQKHNLSHLLRRRLMWSLRCAKQMTVRARRQLSAEFKARWHLSGFVENGTPTTARPGISVDLGQRGC